MSAAQGRPARPARERLGKAIGAPLRTRSVCRAAACIACLPLALAACGSSGEAPKKPRQGGTLTVATAFEPPTLDPTLGNTDPGSADTIPQLFDQLVELLPGTTKIQPGLASSWERSGDGLTYTFHLRRARFSDGSPVTSADVVFSLRRALDPQIDPNHSGTLGFIKRVTSSDRSTVVLHLNAPTPATLNFLSYEPASIISKAYFLRVGAKRFAEHPLGSGAFRLERWQRGRELVLTRNPYYWRAGLPHLDKAVIKFLGDDNARILALESGAVDVNDSVPTGQLRAVAAHQGIEVLDQPVAATFAVTLSSLRSPALADVSVRQALSYATPKSAIAKVVFGNDRRIANSVMPPLEHWDRSIAPYPYDLAKAKQLMARSKAPDGFPLTVGVLAGNDPAIQTATILQEAWAKIGVKVTVHQGSLLGIFTDLESGRANAAIFNPTQCSSDITSEDEFGRIITTGFFKTSFGYDNPEVNRVMTQAMATLDEAKRQSLWSQVQKMMLHDAPWVPIVYASVTPAVRSNVNGFRFLPTAWWRLEYLFLSQ